MIAMLERVAFWTVAVLFVVGAVLHVWPVILTAGPATWWGAWGNDVRARLRNARR